MNCLRSRNWVGSVTIIVGTKGSGHLTCHVSALQIKKYFTGCSSILFLGTPWSISHPRNPCRSKHSDYHSLMPIMALVTKCCHVTSPAPGLQLSY